MTSHQDDESLKDVLHLLETVSDEILTQDIGVPVNSSVFSLLQSFNQPETRNLNENKVIEQTDDFLVSNSRCVPRFASGVCEKCSNSLTLAEFCPCKRKKILSPIPRKQITARDTIVLNVNDRSRSDTSLSFFISNDEFDWSENELEFEGNETANFYFFPKEKLKRSKPYLKYGCDLRTYKKNYRREVCSPPVVNPLSFDEWLRKRRETPIKRKKKFAEFVECDPRPQVVSRCKENLKDLADEALAVWKPCHRPACRRCGVMMMYPAVSGKILRLQNFKLNKIRKVYSEVCTHHSRKCVEPEFKLCEKNVLNFNVSQPCLHGNSECLSYDGRTKVENDGLVHCASFKCKEVSFWFLPMLMDFNKCDLQSKRRRYRSKISYLRGIQENIKCDERYLCFKRCSPSHNRFYGHIPLYKLLYGLVKVSQVNDIRSYNPKEIAAQLTLVDVQLLQLVDETEIYCTENAFQMKYLIAWNDRLCNLTMTEILQEPSRRMRERMLCHFLTIVCHLLELNNFNSSFAILSGICSPPLANEIQKLNARHCELLNHQLKTLQKNRRKLWTNCAEVKLPAVVYFGDLIGLMVGEYPQKSGCCWDSPVVLVDKSKKCDVKSNCPLVHDWHRTESKAIMTSRKHKYSFLNLNEPPPHLFAMVNHFKDAVKGYDISEDTQVRSYLLCQPYRSPEKNFELGKLYNEK